jgi:hypothetical protein
MNNDITWEKIVDWVEGRLTNQEAQAFATALASASEATQAEAIWVRAFYKLGASVPLKDLSDSARQKLRAEFEQWSARRNVPQPLAALSRFFRVFAATLSLDSWTMPLVGVRYGDVPRDSRQLIYTSELADIALNIRPHNREGILDLRCQVFASGDSSSALNFQSISAQLIQGAVFRQTQVTDLGDFLFSQLQPGNYDLSLVSDDFEIAIPNLSLSL